MTPSSSGVVLVVLVVLAGLGAIAAFRSGARGGYRVARRTQEVTRMGGALGRALGTTVVLVGLQWMVLASTADPRAWGVALSVPALFAGNAIVRMFSVTEILHTPSRTGGRR